MKNLLRAASIAAALAFIATTTAHAQYVVEQTVNGGANARCKGQTFTTDVGIAPAPGVVATLGLTNITFYRSAQGWTGPSSEFFLNIYDEDPVNGTGVFLGSSINSVDVAPLINLDPAAWKFDHLPLAPSQKYWAILSSTNTDGGFDVWVGMREGGSDPYAGGNAIRGSTADPDGYFESATTDYSFRIDLTDSYAPAYGIDQTVSGGANANAKGQTFTPNVGIDPDPGTPTTLDLTAISMIRSSHGWNGPTSEFFMNIYDGDPVNGTGVFVGSSRNSVDVAAMGDRDRLTWTFPLTTLEYGHQYWALFSSTATDGGLDVRCGMREGGSDPYVGGVAIRGTAADPDGFYESPTTDFSCEIDFVDSQPLTSDFLVLGEMTPGAIRFDLDAGVANATDMYFLVFGTLGTSPGTTLPGGLVLPVNYDEAFTPLGFMMTQYNVFTGFSGKLDAAGRARAGFRWPGMLGSVGMEYSFAGCTAFPFDFVSNPLTVTILP